MVSRIRLHVLSYSSSFKRGQLSILLCTTLICTNHYEHIHVHILAKCIQNITVGFHTGPPVDYHGTTRTRKFTLDILSNIGGGLWSFGSRQDPVISAIVSLVTSKSSLCRFPNVLRVIFSQIIVMKNFETLLKGLNSSLMP